MAARGTALTVIALCLMGLRAPPALADAGEIRLAKQFSMGYVQFNILEHRQLIEKHASALGLGDSGAPSRCGTSIA